MWTIDAVGPAVNDSTQFNRRPELCQRADAGGQAADGRKGLEATAARIRSAHGAEASSSTNVAMCAEQRLAQGSVRLKPPRIVNLGMSRGGA